MKWTLGILTFWLVCGGAQSVAAESCPTASQVLQSIVEPKEYYSAVRRIEREQGKIGTQWLEDVSHRDLKRSTPLEIETGAYIEGKFERKFSRGYAIRRDPAGSPIERYAYALKKNNNQVLIVSDDAVDFAESYGYQDSKVRVRSLNQKVNAKVDVIVLNSDILYETKFPTLIPHESTHGHFRKLDAAGKGTSHSISFYDFKPIKAEDDFYQSFQNMEEQLTWVQDFIRKSRVIPETKVQALFRKSGAINPHKILRFDTRYFPYVESIFRKAEPRLKNAIEAIQQKQKYIEENFEVLALKRNGKPRDALKLNFGKSERVDIPINSQKEWDLIAKYNRASPADQKKIKQEMIQIWKGKLEQQLTLNQKTFERLQELKDYYYDIGFEEKITYEEYRKFRAHLTGLLEDLRIRSVSSP